MNSSSYLLRLSMVLRYDNDSVCVCSTSDSIFILSTMSYISALRGVLGQVICEILSYLSYGALISRVLGNYSLLCCLLLDRLLSHGVLVFRIV